MKNKVKTYCLSALLLTFILTLLRCVSLAAFYDDAVGYFKPSFVPAAMNALYILTSLWCLSSLLLIPNGQIKTEFTPNLTSVRSASLFAALVFIFSSASIFAEKGSSRFTVLCVIFAALSALFFIFAYFNNRALQTARAFMSIALVATFIFILASLYFDMSIAMNSPHKILGSFALMAAMIMALCETRIYLGKPLPRLHLASSLLTFVLGISLVLSALIYLFTASPSAFVTNPIILGNMGYAGVIIGISVYAVARSFTFVDAAEPKAETSPEASTEE